METVTIVLILVLAVIASGALSRIVPLPLPLPLFQIALGAVIGLFADLRVTLDPESSSSCSCRRCSSSTAGASRARNCSRTARRSSSWRSGSCSSR